MFNIWPIRETAPGELEFDITRTNLPMINHLTPDWITKCLASLNIDTKVISWVVNPCRCHYYSDYPDSEVWEDRWPLTWTVRTICDDFEKPVNSIFKEIPVDFYQRDPTWSFDYFNPRHDKNALIILALHNVSNEQTLNNQIVEIENNLLSRGYDHVVNYVFRHADDWIEGRVNVSINSLSNNYQVLDAALLSMKEMRIAVNWKQLW